MMKLSTKIIVDPAYVEHVAMSKQLGINCGVVDVVAPTCETDAELCAVSALCEQATVASGSAKAWSEAVGKAGHVSLAKEYGLACDVLVVEVNKACSYDNPAGCDDRVLCLRSISKGKWDQRPKYLTTVDEAKKRGLTCGVGGGFKANYADAFKNQSLLKRQQLQYALKKLGFYSSSIDGLWGSGTSSAIVEYAQANGVNSSSPSSVFSSILSKVDVPSSFEVAKTSTVARVSSGSGTSDLISTSSAYSGNTMFAPRLSSVISSCEISTNFNAYAHCIKNNYRRKPNEDSVQSFFAQVRAIQEDFQKGVISESKARAMTYSAYNSGVGADNRSRSASSGCYKVGNDIYCN
jgi:hypothetical protein